MTADRATERLVRAREYTDEAGCATAEVVAEPYAEDDRLHVPITVLTTGERHTLTFRLPETWETDDPVVRLVEEVGYGPGGIEMLVGERFPVDLDDDGPQPAFDAGREAAREDEERGRRARVVGAVDTAVGGLGRRLGRTVHYGVALTVFGGVVTVGALTAATVTYAIVLGGLLVATAAAWLGGVGTAALLASLAVAGAVGVARRLRSRRREAVGTVRRARGRQPELLRNR